MPVAPVELSSPQGLEANWYTGSVPVADWYNALQCLLRVADWYPEGASPNPA